MRTIRKLLLFVFFAVSFFSFYSLLPASAAGATLFLSPGSGSYMINKSFVVKVMVDSGDGVGINAAEGAITYDSAYLTVSKLSTTNSIFKLWTADPSYSNNTGAISFGGGAPGAYKGSAGEIFTITFTAKKLGETEVKWTSGIVLAADGKGTNVFSGFGHAKYAIIEGGKKEASTKKKKEEPAEKGVRPPLPEISSVSHPEQNKWYIDNEPEFKWKILADLTGVSYGIDAEPAGDPGAVSDGIIETIKLDPQEDGEWYFHVKYQNRFGWGQIGHRKVLIDATPPEAFTIIYDNEGDPTNPTPKFRFSTTDKTSGLSHYLINIGLEKFNVKPAELGRGYYQSEPILPGQYQAEIAAVDKAGNSASSSIRFTIDPLKAPIIIDIPKVIDRRNELIIRGTSFYPQATVKLYIGSDGKDSEEYSIITDNEGNWTHFHIGELKKGNYEVWAKLIDDRGAQSLNSSKHLLTVVSPSIIDSYCWLIIIILLIIIIGLILYILYQRKEFKVEKIRIFTEIDEVKSKLGKIFAALREEVDELIELADRKPGLSDAERRVKEKLQESLDISEEFISKEVEDVEKEIKLKKK